MITFLLGLWIGGIICIVTDTIDSRGSLNIEGLDNLLFTLLAIIMWPFSAICFWYEYFKNKL